MATYPGAVYTTPSRNDADMSAATDHETWHDQGVAEIRAIQIELGTNPSAAFSTVKDRLDKFATASSTWSSPISTGITAGNGTVNASYAQLGPIVVATYSIVFGSTSVMGDPIFNLPVTAADARGINGFGYAVDATGVDYTIGASTTGSTSTVRAQYDGATLSSTVPFTWATSDAFSITIVYFA